MDSRSQCESGKKKGIKSIEIRSKAIAALK